MRAIAIGLVLALPLAGCATSKPAMSATDKPAYHVQCDPNRRDLCFAKANTLCPHGYDEVRPEGGMVVATPPPGTGNSPTPLPTVEATSLYITCK